MFWKQHRLGHVPADDFSPIVEILYNGVALGAVGTQIEKAMLRDPDRQSTSMYAFFIRPLRDYHRVSTVSTGFARSNTLSI
jgi:hypothetical protein